jgi:hypothetical protein
MSEITTEGRPTAESHLDKRFQIIRDKFIGDISFIFAEDNMTGRTTDERFASIAWKNFVRDCDLQYGKEATRAAVEALRLKYTKP